MSDISLKVTSDSSQARQDLGRLQDSVNKIEQTTTKTTKTLGSLALQVTAAFAAFSATRAITRASDTFTNLENRIALVTGRTSELVKVQEELYKISIRTRGSLEGSVEVFNRFGLALSKAGKSSEELLKATEAVQKAVALSGADGPSAQAAIVQLGQGLAAGALRGQELNSVMEQTPRIAQAIADNLGVGIGELRGLAEQGTLTTDVVFKALLEQTDKLNEEFGRLGPTFSQGLQRAGTALSRLLAEFAKVTKFSTLLGTSLTNTANRLDAITDNLAPQFELLTTRFQLLLINARLLGAAFGNLFRSLGQQILLTLPIIRTFTAPIEVLARSILFDQIQSNFDGFYKSTVRAREGVRGVVEALGGFVLFGDTQTSRNVFRIFNAESIQEFTKEINNLATGLDPTDIISGYATIGVSIRDNFIRPFAVLTKEVKSFGAALGLIRNPLIELSFFRVDRVFELFNQAIQTTAYLISGIITPIIVKFLLTFSEGIRNLVVIIRTLFGVGPGFFEQLGYSINSLELSLRLFLFRTVGLDVALGSLYGAITSFSGLRFVLFEAITASILIFQNSAIRAIETFGKVQDFYENTIDGIVNESKRLANSAINFIKEFTEKVKDLFFDVYDKIVGNSYWPDTIQGIIDWTDKLVSNVIPKIVSFGNKVKTTFQNIFRDVKNAFSSIELNLSIDTEDAKDYVISFAEKVKQFASLLVATFALAFADPDLYKRITSLVVQGLRGDLAFAFLGVIQNVFNVSVFKEIGEALGAVIGTYVNLAIRSIPAALQAISDFIGGFATQFLDQFGLIGKGINTLIDAFSFGQDGLLGYLLLGSLPLLLSNIGMVQSAIQTIQSLVVKVAAPNADSGGILGKALLGNNFKYLLGAITLIFTSLTSSSNTFLALFAATPLLFTAILGEDVTGKLIKDAASRIFAFLLAQAVILSTKVTKLKFFEKLLGSDNAGNLRKSADRLKDIILGTIGRINDKSNREAYLSGEKSFGEFINGYSKGTSGNISKVIADKTKAGIAAVQNGLTKATNSVKESLAEKSIVGSSPVILGKLQELFAKAKARIAAINIGSATSTNLSGINVAIDQVASTVEQKAGKEGLLSKLFGGIRGKFAFGSILALLGLWGTAAKAATDTVEGETQGMFDTILGFVAQYGELGVIAATLFPAGGLVYIATAFSRVTQGAVLAAATTTTAFNFTFAGLIAGFTRVIATIGLATKALLLFSLKAIAVTAVIGLAAVVAGFLAIGAAIYFTVKAVAALSVALIGLLLNPIVLAIVAGVTALGALGTWLFGKGDTLGEKFDNLIFRLTESFTAASKLEKQLNETLAPRKIKGAEVFDFSKQIAKVDFKNLEEGLVVRKRLEAATKSYIEVQKQAIKEEEEFGEATEETAKLLKEKADNLNKAFSAAEFEATSKGIQNALNQLDQTVKNQFLFNKPIFAGTFEGFEKGITDAIQDYTVFNDVLAKTNQQTVDKIKSQTNVLTKGDLAPFTSKEDLTLIRDSVLQYEKLQKGLTGLRAISSKFRGEDNTALQESIRLQGNLIAKILEEARARAQLKKDAKELTDVYNDIKALGAKVGVDIETKNLFALGKKEADALKSFYTDQFTNLQKQIDDAGNNIERQQFQTTLDLKIAEFKTQIEVAALQRSVKGALEAALQSTGNQIDIDDFIGRNVLNLQGIKGALDSNTKQLITAINNRAATSSSAEYERGTRIIKDLSNQQFELILSGISDRSERLALQLSKAGQTVDSALIATFAEADVGLIEKLTKDIRAIDAITANRPLNRNEAKRRKNLQEQLQETIDFAGKNFQERFAALASKGQVQVDVDKLLKYRFNPTQIKEAYDKVQKIANLEKQKAELDLRNPIDLTKARLIDIDIDSTKRDIENQFKPLGDVFEKAISLSGSSISLEQLFAGSNEEALQQIVDLTNEIEGYKKGLEEVNALPGPITPERIKAIEIYSNLIEENTRKLEKKMPSIIGDIFRDALAFAGSSLSLDQLFSGTDFNALKQIADLTKEGKEYQKVLKDLENQTGPITEEQIKKIVDANKKLKDLNDTLESQLPEAFAAKLDRVGSSLSNLSKREILDLGLDQINAINNRLKEREGIVKKIGEKTSAISQAELDSLKAIEKQIEVQKRSVELSQSFLDNTKQTLTTLLKTGKFDGKGFLTGLSDTIVNNFANQLNNFLFKGLANKFGEFFGIDIFGELGSSAANPIFAQVTNLPQTVNTMGTAVSSTLSGPGFSAMSNPFATATQATFEQQKQQAASMQISSSGFGGEVPTVKLDESNTPTVLKDGFLQSATQFTAPLTMGLGALYTLGALTGANENKYFAGFMKLLTIVVLTLQLIELWSKLQAIKSSFKLFAQGGFVSGPGTGTSDSIPAMLSNGEYVINASMTKKFAPLLEAINENKLGKYAEGGAVGTMAVSPTIMSSSNTLLTKSEENNNQQVINVNITGDISRQTKAEVYRILPSIAEGVNMYNREKGYKP